MATESKKSHDPQVLEKPQRRILTAEYKRRILAAADQLVADGEEVGPMLRKEGLYRSQLNDWRKIRAKQGDAGLEAQKRGPKTSDAAADKLEIRKRDRQIARLERELAQAKAIIDIQKKVAEMMALSEPNDDENAS